MNPVRLTLSLIARESAQGKLELRPTGSSTSDESEVNSVCLASASRGQT